MSGALHIDWKSLSSLKGSDLKRATFKAIQEISYAIQSYPQDDPATLESVPRLADLVADNPNELANFRELIGGLARSTGLWNYIDVDHADVRDALIAEAVTSPELDGITLHREQIRALNSLLSGKNLILSAPTSFGKSLLVDALLATGRYHRIAIVLPTIALLDEFRRRFQSRFNGKYKIIMHQSELSTDDPTIFLGTQERLIYREDIGNLDLTVVDEFYKLDPSRVDDRSITLNAAVYKLLKRSKQFFFLGPNIDSVSVAEDASWNFEFLKTRFSTVAVDTLDLQHVANKRERLIDEISEDGNWPALVFVSSPDKANKLAIELSEKMAVSDYSSAFADWLKENIGENGYLSKAVEFGFGVHHGRIPRAIAARMVRMFNQQMLPVLLCTSTLIEGVNTAAKTVMIFDKTIQKRDYDFFTFSNIKGRAGRLGQHHVGKVMLFNEAPKRTELDVSPTMFGNDGEYPDEFIVHIEEPERSTRSDFRYKFFERRLGLTNEGLRIASSVGLDSALQLKAEVEQSLNKSQRLLWTGWPKYPEILELCQVICTTKSVQSFGAYKTTQLAVLINKLRQSQKLKNFLLEQDAGYKGRPEGHDSIFKFLRACEYGLPQHFSLVELFVKQFYSNVDYSLFIGGISSWFKPEVLKELDEEGLPIQITERFYREGDTKISLKSRLIRISQLNESYMSQFEKDWISEAL